MALMKKRFTEIPTDAVILTKDEALKYQLDIVKGWKHKEDVWIFNYGHTILASFSALSSIYINNHYRVKFRLLNYGRFSSYLPVVALPSLVSGIFHQQFVVTDVLLQTSCPVCVELRAVSFQALFSTIFPTILAPLAALPCDRFQSVSETGRTVSFFPNFILLRTWFAIRYNTYSVPPITQQPYKVFQMLLKHTKPIGNILLGIIAIQGIVASLVTYKEMDSIHDIHSKLNALEQRLEEQFGNQI